MFTLTLSGGLQLYNESTLGQAGWNPNARQSVVSVLTALNSQHGLIDISRVRHKDEWSFTWTGRNPNDNSLVRTRIDKFFISRSISHFVIDTSIKVFANSDHDCVTLTLDFDCVRRGSGFWHF